MKKISKKLRSCALVLAMAFVAAGIAGCEQAPDQESDNSTEVELTSEQYVTVAEAKEQARELAGGSLDGIYFPDYIALPEGDSVSTIKLTPWHMTEDDSDKILEAVQGIWQDYGSVDWSQIEDSYTYDSPGDYYWAVEKHDEDTGRWFSYDANGFFCVNSLQGMGMLYGDSCVKSYDFEWGDEAGEDTWQLMDGECSVSEAVETVEGLLNEYLSPLEDNAFTYRVQHLYVMKNPDTGCYEYNISIGRVYEDMAVETSSHYEFNTTGQYYDVVHSGAHSIALMRHKGVLDCFNVVTRNALISIESAEEEESIISPIWAAQQIKDEIAHANRMSFSDVGLVYVLEQDNAEAEDHMQDTFQAIDDTTYLRPVWAFLATPSSSSLYSGNTQDSHGECVLVDAVTGELYHYDCTGIY
ncbi:MAG: hypothetical protein LUI02_06915 [Clostridiales bacterium]|nr:hypothetical protein [Clostridiales bacterium]